jgi:hypothetical protein
MTEDSQNGKSDHRDERKYQCILHEPLPSIVLHTCPNTTQIHVISFGSHGSRFYTLLCPRYTTHVSICVRLLSGWSLRASNFGACVATRYCDLTHSGRSYADAEPFPQPNSYRKAAGCR